MDPVDTVEIEPDYWSRGHFYQGSRHIVRPLAQICVQELPVGTVLYALTPEEVSQLIAKPQE